MPRSQLVAASDMLTLFEPTDALDNSTPDNPNFRPPSIFFFYLLLGHFLIDQASIDATLMTAKNFA